MLPEAAAAQIVNYKGLRDDTTCMVVDILPPQKQESPLPAPKKHGMGVGVGVIKNMFRRRPSESSMSSMDKDYPELDEVEELFEEGSAMLAKRLDIQYPHCNMFKLFMCAVCQIEIKPKEGTSVHAGSSDTGKTCPWNGPFLCNSCQAKKEAMEGKRPAGGRGNSSESE